MPIVWQSASPRAESKMPRKYVEITTLPLGGVVKVPNFDVTMEMGPIIKCPICGKPCVEDNDCYGGDTEFIHRVRTGDNEMALTVAKCEAPNLGNYIWISVQMGEMIVRRIKRLNEMRLRTFPSEMQKAIRRFVANAVVGQMSHLPDKSVFIKAMDTYD